MTVGLLAVVQVVDIVLHAAIGQLEPVRVAANLIVLAWLAAGLLGRLRSRSWALGVRAAYLLLNGFFLGVSGITIPGTGDQLRITLILLIVSTTVLLTRLSRWKLKK